MGRQRTTEDGGPVVHVEGCPDAGAHYVTKLQKPGLMTPDMLSRSLNEQYGHGYRFAFAFQSEGLTALVFEHNHP